MDQTIERAIILIPSLEPDARILGYIKRLNQYGLSRIIIVDDGSGEEYQDTFKALEECGCTVLKHDINIGKGSALKTGYRYIKDNIVGYSCIVTADSDGQHSEEDVYKLAIEAGGMQDGLLLGVRDFKKAGIPAKSLIGNRITAAVLAGLYGRYIPDTQTGLRAFGPNLIDLMLDIKGERFEYETQVLISCIRSNIPISTIPIQTIYENENRGTHFNAVRDSLKIIGIIMGDFVKFFLSSLICAVIDMGIAWILFDLLKAVMHGRDFLRIIFATAVARCISVIVNYLLNKNLVFKNNNVSNNRLLRYLILCTVNMLLSAVGVYMIHTVFGLDEKITKLICDGCLFIFSYYIQQRWVFRA
ncbi:bifunctional glycosyltransferase family 2/GtrA family protein [Clostridium sp. CS001]|uniref:bifunctional glycosyltransferase family 2/GtrA family protein n=1 Tax=Clostridium sp. CS001 TaxID=2880648 RepID=UPI001CF4CD1A|nr:bifunctional glycosyltransferase family 2/GtrA family protein [Clostridium sp. CS001]MCB2290347.1 bifunctional glycosyltransferase family 2/GtrA family protein [Clostridium sp. CS001]